MSPATDTSSRVATVLALFCEHAEEWQSTTPGHPAQAAEAALGDLLHGRRLRAEHLREIHDLLLTGLPPAHGLGGPHHALLDAIAAVGDPASVPVLLQLYRDRRPRGLDGTEILSVLTRMHHVPDAVDAVVALVAADQPSGGAGLLASIAEPADNAARCFPAWCELFDDAAYGWTVLELATGFRVAGTLPDDVAPHAAAALGDHLVGAAQAWMEASQHGYAGEQEMEQYEDVLRLAVVFADQPELREVLDQIVDQCQGELALPLIDAMLDADQELHSDRVGELAAPVHLRRRCYDILSTYGLAEHIPEAYRSPEAWAEVEVAEAMIAAGIPVPPNQLTPLGHSIWASAPEGCKGTYFVFAVTRAEAWQVEVGQGDLETLYLGASGPHSNSVQVTPTCEPWPAKPGTRIDWSTPLDTDDPQRSWSAWMAAYPGRSIT